MKIPPPLPGSDYYKKNKGMCSRCGYSEKKELGWPGGKIRKYLFCKHYARDCERVAWNCWKVAKK
jgi:hypothetical protein